MHANDTHEHVRASIHCLKGQ